MDIFTATAIAEGWHEDAEEMDDETVTEAWQTLVSTGVAWQLQGCIGRQAAALIEAGVIDAH